MGGKVESAKDRPCGEHDDVRCERIDQPVRPKLFAELAAINLAFVGQVKDEPPVLIALLRRT